MNTQSLDQAEGERRKADALATLSANREVVIRRAQRALLTALLDAGTATADDVRGTIDLPPGIDPVCLGAVPTTLARAGTIHRDGYAPMCRPMAHARPLSVWRLADRAKALRWLRDHPNFPDPGDVCVSSDARQGLLFEVTESATAAGF